MTDYQRFDSFVQSAAKAPSVMTKVELLKSAIDLYDGKILVSAEGEHWLIRALKEQGLDELASNELDLANHQLTADEYSELLSFLNEAHK